MAQPTDMILQIECLNRFRLLHRGVEIDISSAKARALIVYLALTPGERHSRNHLASLLWTNRFQEQARQSVRQCVRYLRKSLGEASRALISEHSYVAFDENLVNVDALKIHRLHSDDHLERLATELTAAPILMDLGVGTRNFDLWLRTKREGLVDLVFSSLKRLAEQHESAITRESLLAAVQKFVGLYPLRDDAHRLLTQLYLDNGRRVDAIVQNQRHANMLVETFGTNVGQKADYLLAQQRSVSRPSLQTGLEDARPTVAVLPFSDLSDAVSPSNYGSGLTGDLVTELSRYRWLSVSAQAYGRRNSFEQTGHTLDARYVLNGDIRTLGNRRRITVRLIDTNASTHLWAERFDRPINDTLHAHDQLVASIASTIEPVLTSAEWHRAKRRPAGQLSSWDFYARGAWHLFHFSSRDVATAQESFRNAIKAEEDFSPPYVGLAYACRLALILDYADAPDETLQEGLEAGQRAVYLDDQDFYAHSILGRLHMIAGDHEAAISEARMAVDRNPNSAQAHFGLGLSLTMAGDARRAADPLSRAVTLSPHDPNLSSYASLLSTCHLLQHDYRKAIRWARVALRQPSSHFIAQMQLVAALGLTGDKGGAERACAKLLTLKPDFSLDYVVRRWPFKRKSDIQCMLRGLRNAGISS